MAPRNELNDPSMTRFDALPDDVLLDIFDFYMDTSRSSSVKEVVEAWQILVRVCRRWRSVVFGSPRRLNLRLVCTPKTRISNPKTLDRWPALPLVVKGMVGESPGKDNIIAALGQRNRVCQVDLVFASSKLETVVAALLIPLPELTEIRLRIYLDTSMPDIPDSFLGGSAPRLRRITLIYVPYPGLPKLLSTATNLVHLMLFNIPSSGFISAEEMATSLSVMSSLESLHLHFLSQHSFPDSGTQRPTPSQPSVLHPTLNKFSFRGIAEYLEDLVSRIDTPQLDGLCIEFLGQTDFDYPRLVQFLNRTHKFEKRNKANLHFDDLSACFLFGILLIVISCGRPDERLSTVAQTCNFLITSRVVDVEDLYIECQDSHLPWENDGIENTLWLQLLHPFTTVRNLYLSEEFTPGITAALQELVGDRITEVLPSLQNIFVDGLERFKKNVGQFVVARQLSGHPVTISDWYKPTMTGS